MNCERMNSQQKSINSNNISDGIKSQKQNNSHKHEEKMMDRIQGKNEFTNRSKIERSVNTNLGNNIDRIV